ncbi:MAG: UbiA family prenyltransferase [Acidobacteriota bacterium]
MISAEETDPLRRERAVPAARSLVALLRLGDWWPHLVPVILACLYACLVLGAEAVTLARRLPWFLVALVALASFGYLLNDLADAEQDRRVGRRRAAFLRPAQHRALVVLSLLVGLLGWTLLAAPPAASLLLALQLALLVAYSVPPLRLKERGLLGVIADALYGHVLPVAITLLVFAPAPGVAPVALAVVLWSLAKGLRNILLHQIEDRKRDRRAAVRTLLSRRPPLAVLSAINRGLLPLEIVALSVLLVVLAPAWWGFVAFLVFTFLKFSAWKLWSLPKRYRRLKFLWFLNDFYEEWIGPILILILAATDGRWLLLLPLHLLLFPRLLRRMGQDLPTIGRNLQ